MCFRKGFTGYISFQGVTSDDFTIAVALLDAGYELNEVPERTQCHKFGGTAIKMAAEQGATELVELFLSRGADPDLAGLLLFGRLSKLHARSSFLFLTLDIIFR